MTSDEADGFVKALEEQDEGLTNLLAIVGNSAPRLLQVLCHASSQASSLPTSLEKALDNLKTIDPPLDGNNNPLAWIEPPHEQAKRVADAVWRGWRSGVEIEEGLIERLVRAEARSVGHPSEDLQHIGRSAALRTHWLFAAAKARKVSQLSIGGFGSHDHVVGSCRLPLALMGEDGNGAACWLTLHLVNHRDAVATFAPVPACALLFRGGVLWDATLAQVHQLLHQLVDPGKVNSLQNLALAWEISPQQRQSICIIEGNSAGATFALGALWLLRVSLRPEWQSVLCRIEQNHLVAAACSAALVPSGRVSRIHGPALGEVGGLDQHQKLKALQPWSVWVESQGQGHPLVIRISPLQRVLPNTSAPISLSFVRHDNLRELVKAIADSADALDDGQEALHQLLIQGQPDQPLQRPTKFQDSRTWDSLLHAVRLSTNTLRTWSLRNWAEWEHTNGGRVQETFVPLNVKVEDAPPSTSLYKLIADNDPTGICNAYVLVGEHGAGKSTQLRHFLQSRARALLQVLAGVGPPRLPQQPGWTHQSSGPEVAVYVRLAGLENTIGVGTDDDAQRIGVGTDDVAQREIWTWIYNYLRMQRAPEALVNLVFFGTGDWQARGLRPRLLLDGLNEARSPIGTQPAARASLILKAAWRGLIGEISLIPPLSNAAAYGQFARNSTPNPLPMLVAARATDFKDNRNPILQTLHVDQWVESDYAEYAKRRLGVESAQRHLAGLVGPERFQMFETPLHFALQCDLWASNYDFPVDKPQTLFAAAIWQRLHRALHPPAGESISDCWLDDAPESTSTNDQIASEMKRPSLVLLGERDQKSIGRIKEILNRLDQIHNLPNEGVLFNTLIVLANLHWSIDGNAGQEGSTRTVNPQLWDDPTTGNPKIAADLPPLLRDKFAKASVQLGIATFEEDFRDSRKKWWKFRHECWGEYFAQLHPNHAAHQNKSVYKHNSKLSAISKQAADLREKLAKSTPPGQDLLDELELLEVERQKIKFQYMMDHGVITDYEIDIHQHNSKADIRSRHIGNNESHRNTLWVYFAGEPACGKSTALQLYFARLRMLNGKLNLAYVRENSTVHMLDTSDKLTSGRTSWAAVPDPRRTVGYGSIRLRAGDIPDVLQNVILLDSSGESWSYEYYSRMHEPLLSHDCAAAVFCVAFKPEGINQMHREMERLQQRAEDIHHKRSQGAGEKLPLNEIWLITKFDLAMSDFERDAIQQFATDIRIQRHRVNAEVIIMDVGNFLRLAPSEGEYFDVPPATPKTDPLDKLSKAFARQPVH